MNATIRGFILLTAFLGIMPFIPYDLGRLSGRLPTEEVWRSYGGNHGPWWDSWIAGFTILLPMLALMTLPIVTAGVALVSPSIRRDRCVLLGLVIAALQWVILYAHMVIVFWVVD
jgi:hypothetical protein